MKRTCIILYMLLCATNASSYAQTDFGKAKSYFNFKMSGYFFFLDKRATAGGLSASFGAWKEMVAFTDFRIQPAFNVSANMVVGQNNLGNKNRYRNRLQFNIVASPLLTMGTGKRGLYEEIAPFYFGNSNSVYSNYKFSGTIGSNFVLMPQGVRRNIATFRNRTQQLIYIGLRIPLDSVKNIQLNIYEDFLGFTSTFQGLADNFDRFFTGGGNLQVRLHENVKVKFYSEIYTGNFSRDMYDFPDLYLPDKYLGRKTCRKFLRRILTEQHSKKDTTSKEKFKSDMHPRYVAQEPGQKMFNNGRNFFELEFGAYNQNVPKYYQKIDDNIKVPKPLTGSVYMGWQGGHKQMRVQNYIHNFDTIDKINIKEDADPIDELNVRKKNKFKFERLHHFYPSYEKGKIFVGVGLSYLPQYSIR